MSRKKNKEPIITSSDNFDDPVIRKHIFYLIILSLAFKIATIITTLFVFRSAIDYFDLRTNVVKSIFILNGKIPYLDFYHEYPVLALIPNIIAGIPSAIFNNLILSFTSFQLLMILFDVGTTICVYFVALKIYNKKSLAFTSGVIYTLSLCAAYTTLTRFDSFPVFLMMVSIYLILYKRQVVGYTTLALGFFTKIFPIISLPFLLIYELKSDKSMFKERIQFNIVIYFLLFALCIAPFIFLTGVDKALKVYLIATGSNLNLIYVNTFTYTIYSWLHDLLKIGIDYNTLTSVMTGIVICLIIFLLVVSYKMKKMSELNLIQFIGASILLFVVFSKFHSPQYFMWFAPLFAILVVDDIYKIVVFFIVQFLAFMEFPLMYGHYYTNVNYTNAVGTYNWYVTILFFTIEYLFIFLLLYQNVLGTIKYNMNQYIHGET
jgi:hypothetical protein